MSRASPGRIARRARARHSREAALAQPERLTEIPEEQWPRFSKARLTPDGIAPRIAVWVSRRYLVQVFDEGYALGDDVRVTRLSICRTTLQTNGHLEDGLSWDELQGIKREIGFGEHYAVEVYPRDVDVVNVANMRHLWVLDRPLPIGWFRRGSLP